MIKNVFVFLVVLLSLISFLIRQLFQFCCFFSLLKILWVFSRFLLISHGSCQLSSDICKHFKVLKWPSVLHPYVFWANYLLSVQKYLVFSAFGEGCLCLLKMFLSICRLYFIQFLHEIYMEKVLQELAWVPFLGAHTIQMVPKYIWLWHWSWSNIHDILRITKNVIVSKI